MDAILATNASLVLLAQAPGGEDMRRFAALTHKRNCIVGANMRAAMRGAPLHCQLIDATHDLRHQREDIVIGGYGVYTSYWPLIDRIFLSRFTHPVQGVPLQTMGAPLDFSAFEQSQVLTASDHTFEIWVRRRAAALTA